jgi:hypothetical protein
VDMMGLHFKGIEGGLQLASGKGIVTPLRKPLKTTDSAAAPAPTSPTPLPTAEKPPEVKL